MADILTQAGAALQNALDSTLARMLVVATGNAVQLPPALGGTDKPLVLTGSISVPEASQAAAGTLPGQAQIAIQTSAGKIVISADTLPAIMPRGTVAVAIQPGSPPTATILAPMTAQASQAATQAAAPEAALGQAIQTIAQATLPPLAVGQIVTAIVLPAGDRAPVETQAGPSPATAPAIPVAVAGSAAPVAMAADIILQNAIAPAQAGSSGNPAAAHDDPENQGVDAEPSTGSPAPNPPPPPPPPASFPFLSAQAEPQTQRFLILNIGAPTDEAVAPGQTTTPQPAAAPLSSALPPPLQTTVVAQTLQGQPVLAAPAQTLVLTQPASTEPGTQVTLRPLPQASSVQQPTVTAPPAPYTPLPLAAGGNAQWPALTQLVSLLATTQPETLRTLADAIPKAEQGFSESFVAFVAPRTPGQVPAFPTSRTDFRSMDGPEAAAPAMAKALASLLAQVHDDLAVGAKAGTPSRDTHWQSISVPVMTNERLDAIQMFVRRQIDPDETVEDGDAQARSARRGASTRFLVEISPSRLGPVQLDGLLRRQRDDTMRLDMVVRPQGELTAEQSVEIDRLFQKALAAADLKGSLTLQPGREAFVMPSSDDAHHFTRLA